MAQISPKHFSKDLAVEIFSDNSFVVKAAKDTAAGDVDSVDIPLAGDLGAAQVGTPALPLTITERTDDTKNYPLVQVYANPILVKREEDIVLSYDKQKDIVNAQGETIGTKIADYAANAWGPTLAANTILTTGSARAVSLVGATGSRLAITKADLMKVRTRFMRQNVKDLSNIVAVITPDMYDDILNIAEFVDFEKTGLISKLEQGILGRILGFEVMVRWNETLGSTGLHYTADGVTKKANGTVAVTDAAAALFFHKRYVRYAKAHPETIINRKAPGYLGGTIIESVLRFGAATNRGDGRGVVALVEGT